MNRISIILLLFLLSFCSQNQKKNSLEVEVIHNPDWDFFPTSDLDTMWISPKSRIFWKGTKMRKLGSHSGELLFESGYLMISGTLPISGFFVADMRTLQVTDIPKTDPIPRRDLTRHLKNSDFFAVDKYPKATFELLQFTPKEENNWTITGNLIIKGISNPISFEASRRENLWTSEFEIDRFDWNIAYEGSWADRTLVDREILLRLELIFE